MTSPPLSPLPTQKQTLRREALARRRTLSPQQEPEASERLTERLLALPLPASATIAGYWPFDNEINPLPALKALLLRGHRVCLPVVIAPRTPLLFREWTLATALEAGPFRTQHPPASAPSLEPDILLVPLLAFDRHGNRLGFGGGFYDRTIAALHQNRTLLTIGVAYDFQEIDRVPIEATDQPLHWILTPTRSLLLSSLPS